MSCTTTVIHIILISLFVAFIHTWVHIPAQLICVQQVFTARFNIENNDRSHIDTDSSISHTRHLSVHQPDCELISLDPITAFKRCVQQSISRSLLGVHYSPFNNNESLYTAEQELYALSPQFLYTQLEAQFSFICAHQYHRGIMQWTTTLDRVETSMTKYKLTNPRKMPREKESHVKEQGKGRPNKYEPDVYPRVSCFSSPVQMRWMTI